MEPTKRKKVEAARCKVGSPERIHFQSVALARLRRFVSQPAMRFQKRKIANPKAPPTTAPPTG
jgi:hypothetical protein